MNEYDLYFEGIKVFNQQKRISLLLFHLLTEPNFTYTYKEFEFSKIYITLYYKDHQFYIEGKDFIYSSEYYDNIEKVLMAYCYYDIKNIEKEYELKFYRKKAKKEEKQLKIEENKGLEPLVPFTPFTQSELDKIGEAIKILFACILVSFWIMMILYIAFK